MQRVHTTAVSSRAFVVLPLAIVLWGMLIVLGVLLWLKTPPAGYVLPAKGVGPGSVGSLILAVLYGGFWVWVVGGLAEKKGKAVANVTAAITLGFAGIMLGLSFAGLTADQRYLAKNTGQAGGVVITPQPASGSTSGGGTDPGLDRMGKLVDRQNRLGTERSRPQPPTPQPAPSPSGPVVTTPNAPGRPGSPPSAVVPPARVQPAEPEKEHASIAPVTETVQKELVMQIDALLAKADELMPALSVLAPHDLRDVRKRVDDVDAFRAMSQALAKRLSGAQVELSDKLKAAGVSESDAFRSSVQWSTSFGAAQREFAATDYARLAERAAEEAATLRDEFGKWTLNAKRELVCKDVPIRQRLETLRFFILADVKRHAEIMKRLRKE